MKPKKMKPKPSTVANTENPKLNQQSTKRSKADKTQKGSNANQKLAKSYSKNQKPSCSASTKTLDKPNSEGLISYKKKDLSEVNYFIPKKQSGKQRLKVSTENVQTKLLTEEACKAKEGSKSVWNISSDNSECCLKNIMFEEKKKQLQSNQSINYSGTCTKYLQESQSSNHLNVWNNTNRLPHRAISLEEKSTWQTKTNKDRRSSTTGTVNKNVSTASDLQNEIYERKYSLDELLLETKKRENACKWADIKLDQKEENSSAAVEAWLKDNEISLDQIMIEQEIKRRAEMERKLSKTQQTKTRRSTASLNKIKTEEIVKDITKKYKQRTMSYNDSSYFSQDSNNNISRTYSLDYMLQNDQTSEISDDWLQENEICLDQIIIEEKIRKNIERTKEYSQTSSEDYYQPEVGFSTTKITKTPALLNTLMREFKLHNISLRNVPYVLTKLEKNTKEYYEVSHLFFKTVHDFKIDCIKKVVNPYLLLQYNLKKATVYGEERILFHGTKIENLESICTENFDWRQVERHKYGWGVSFSNSAYYASHYSDQKATTMVMFIVKALVGLEWFGDCYTEVPEEPFDTTINLDGRVVVKFDDCCFYPAYVIFYKDNVVRKGCR